MGNSFSDEKKLVLDTLPNENGLVLSTIHKCSEADKKATTVDKELTAK